MHRRLIDLLNSEHMPVILLHGAEMSSEPSNFLADRDSEDVVTVAVGRILFAVPLESTSYLTAPRSPQLDG